MALKTQFDHELDTLFRLRTASIRRAITKERGPVPRLNRTRVRSEIRRIEELARMILIKEVGRSEFRRSIASTRRWHPKAGKGWGIGAKKERFRTWFSREIGSPICVYIFWAGKRCQYVGRTGQGGRRPSAHLEKFWFRQVTRIDIHTVALASEVAKVECLAIDMFTPLRNKVRSARTPYAKRCPVCTPVRRMRRELLKVLRLRA